LRGGRSRSPRPRSIAASGTADRARPAAFAETRGFSVYHPPPRICWNPVGTLCMTWQGGVRLSLRRALAADSEPLRVGGGSTHGSGGCDPRRGAAQVGRAWRLAHRHCSCSQQWAQRGEPDESLLEPIVSGISLWQTVKGSLRLPAARRRGVGSCVSAFGMPEELDGTNGIVPRKGASAEACVRVRSLQCRRGRRRRLRRPRPRSQRWKRRRRRSALRSQSRNSSRYVRRGLFLMAASTEVGGRGRALRPAPSSSQAAKTPRA
jgi:hypothetical protein